MKDYLWLQMFADEGGDASASADAPTEGTSEASTGVESSDAQLDSMMARIPERARGVFKKAYEKTHPSAPVTAEPVAEEQNAHIPLTELIKSEEYKEEHKAYMDKAIADRFKRNDAEMRALNERNAQLQEALGIFAQKYGLDPTANDFVDSLKAKVQSDDSFYENYAMEHGMSVEEAKSHMELERKVKMLEARERAEQQKQEQDAAIRTMMGYAQKTQEEFPDFDLNREMQSKEFRDLLTYYRGDTTKAYKALHFDELMDKTIKQNTAKAKQAITNSIASGQMRPTESGLSNTATAVVNTSENWKNMNTKQMMEYAKTHFVKR